MTLEFEERGWSKPPRNGPGATHAAIAVRRIELQLTTTATATRGVAAVAGTCDRKSGLAFDRWRGRYAENAFQLLLPARRALRRVVLRADEDLDDVVTRFALIFVKRHDSPLQELPANARPL